MDVQELRHLIAVAREAMTEYLELNAPSMAHSDYRDCEDFEYAAHQARRALKNY